MQDERELEVEFVAMKLRRMVVGSPGPFVTSTVKKKLDSSELIGRLFFASFSFQCNLKMMIIFFVEP